MGQPENKTSGTPHPAPLTCQVKAKASRAFFLPPGTHRVLGLSAKRARHLHVLLHVEDPGLERGVRQLALLQGDQVARVRLRQGSVASW